MVIKSVTSGQMASGAGTAANVFNQQQEWATTDESKLPKTTAPRPVAPKALSAQAKALATQHEEWISICDVFGLRGGRTRRRSRPGRKRRVTTKRRRSRTKRRPPARKRRRRRTSKSRRR